jgi:hypothetical protein
MISAKNNSYKKIAAGVLAITIIFSLVLPAIGNDAVKFKRVDQNKVPDELAMLAAVTRANYEKIKTWQGRISFEDMIIYRGSYAADLLKQHAGIKSIKEPNELADKVEGMFEFKIDMEKNLLFRSMNRPKPTEYIDIDKGSTYMSLEGSLERAKIIAGEYEIESCPDRRKKDGTILHRIARKRPRRQSQIITDDFDPRSCFNTGKPAWEFLSEFAEGVRRYNKDPNGAVGNMPNSFFSSVVLEKAQTAKGITYRVKLTIPGAVEEKFTFDGEKGFNPTYVEVKNDKGIKISEITRDFIKIQDIFLPAKQRVVQYDGTDGRLRRKAESTFSDMQVNKVLPESTFSHKNLSLKNGDKFVDEIENKEYTYQDANLVPVKNKDK